jgi:hypothetical protein
MHHDATELSQIIHTYHTYHSILADDDCNDHTGVPMYTTLEQDGRAVAAQ